MLGSGGCGKTCILHRIATNDFSEAYTSTVFENSTWKTRVMDRDVVLLLLDTAGQEDYDRLVSLAVAGADIIVFCYSVDDRRSFDDVRNKYIHVVAQDDLRKAKVALVGNKTDLRKEGCGCVTREEGAMLGAEIGATWIFETSAKNNEGIYEMFDTFARWSCNDSATRRWGGFAERMMKLLKCGCCRSDVDVEPDI
ncbi:UNVERIFIED_CONTAM: hypothetical protein PYX00_011386 [Menopon gallinae]|uniref:Uncharacterized protein n=1 Tax=Menopon gallinae TaxID=328185 RepID=A0AAW2H7I5_9NEOP